jgi:hypothetical protein
MKRLLLTLMLLVALFGASSTLAPHLVAHASTTRAETYTAACDTADGSIVPFNQGTQNYVGYNVEGNGCMAWDTSYVPSVCQQQGGYDHCWDVDGATNVSPSVYQTFADATGYDQCGSGEWVQEMYQGQWFSGSEAESPIAYGAFLSCGGLGHNYQGDYGHFFESSSSSGSYGWTACEEVC